MIKLDPVFENRMKRQAQLEQMKSALNDTIDVLPQIATLYMAYFKALKQAGFTDDQALYLVGQHGTSLGIKGDGTG